MKKPVKYTAMLLMLVTIISWAYFRKVSHTEWQPVTKGPIISAIYGLGTVTSDKIYHLKTIVPTYVKQLYVHEGDEVQAGQSLVQLNGIPLVKAPFEGTITSLSLNVNETVSPNTEVLTVMDLRNCYILVSLEQESAVKIKKGQKVKLSFSGLPNQSFSGFVNSIYPKGQETYVKIIVDQLPPSILPEMTSDIAIVLDEKSDAVLIPTKAIKNSLVTIKHHGKTFKIPIELGVQNDDFAEVISKNLSTDDLILVKT